MRGGQVRCGHCKNVFDGNAAADFAGARGAVFEAPFHDETALGPPTVTLRSSGADRRSAPAPDRAPEPIGRSAGGCGEPAAAPASAPRMRTAACVELPDDPAASTRVAGAQADEVDSQRFASPDAFQGLLDKLAVLALPLLLLALIAQAAFHFRDALAAHVPATKPALVEACALLGCAIGPLRDGAAACRSTPRTCRPIRRIGDC